MTPWYDEKKVRCSIRAYPHLVELVKNDGWELTEFLHQAMLSYTGLVDPRNLHNLEKLNAVIPALKELRPICVGRAGVSSGAYTGKNGQNGPELIERRLEELESLGEALRAHHLYPNIVRDLKRREPEDRDWELVWQDLKQNGFPYDRVDLWNNALEWWKLSKSS